MPEFGSGDPHPYPNPSSLTGLVFQKHLLRLRVAGGSSVKQIRLSIVNATGVTQEREMQVPKL